MTTNDIHTYILKQFHNVSADHPWVKLPHYTVYRHDGNRKWFALVMNITADKLGLSETKGIDVLNVKCDPTMIGSLRKEKGIYTAYHMSKEHWVTIDLGTADPDRIHMLLDMSYQLTK